MTWWALGASVAGGVYGAYQSGEAADAQGKAGKKNLALQQQMLRMQLGLVGPSRQLGYGASSDIANLYGYNLSPYQSDDQLLNGSGAGGPGSGATSSHAESGSGGIIKVDGQANRNEWYGDAQSKKFGGYINPATGEVNIAGDAKRSALLTEYLRSGTGISKKKNPKLGRMIQQIDAMRAQGYKYDPNAATAAPFNPAAPGTPGNPGAPAAPGAEGAPAEGAPAAGNMSRFFASPDFQYRLDQTSKAVDRTAAARGGVLSGNTITAAQDQAGNLASGEFNNYFSRLMQVAGIGQGATAQGGAAVNNYVQGAGQAITQQGDARASGIIGAANSITGGINNGLQGYMMQRYLNSSQPSAQPAGYSPYGPYAGGYQMPPRSGSN